MSEYQDTLFNPKSTANKFVQQIVSIEEKGRKKIVLDENINLKEFFSNSISPEANVLMKHLMSAKQSDGSSLPMDGVLLVEQLQEAEKVTQQQQEILTNLPPEAAALMQQMMMAQESTSMIKVIPKEIEEALKKKKRIPPENPLLIDIENSSILGLYINESTLDEVLETLKNFSSISYEKNKKEAVHYYTDIGINIFFDQDNIVNEIEIGEKYKHPTTKSLKIGDTLEQAVEFYGNPRMKSAKGAIWNRFSVIFEDKKINILRLKIRE